jgi:hypothetical protein
MHAILSPIPKHLVTRKQTLITKVIKLQRQKEAERDRDLVVEGNTGMRANALLSGAESPEILGGFGNHVLVELHHYPPF